MKSILNLKAALVYSLIFLLNLACQKGMESVNQNLINLKISISEAKNWFSNTIVSNENKMLAKPFTELAKDAPERIYARMGRLEQKLNWTNAELQNSEGLEYLIVPVTESSAIDKKGYETARDFIFYKNERQEVQMKIVEIISKKGKALSGTTEIASISFENNFRGKRQSVTGVNANIFFYNEQYNSENSFEILKGIWNHSNSFVKYSPTNTKRQTTNGTARTETNEENCQLWGYFLHHWVNGVIVWSELLYTFNVCNGVVTGDEYGGNGSSGGGGNGNGGESTPTEQALENYDNAIKDSLSHPCLSTILANIKNLPGGKMAKIIYQLSQTIPGWNWALSEGTTTNNRPAETFNASPNGALTVFNYSTIQNYSELAVVRTMLHEAVHAYLVNLFQNDVATFQLDYPQLFEYLGNSTDTAMAHHITMGSLLVGSIADALKAYGQSHGFTLADEVYQDMAWGGLYGDNTGVPAFNSLTPFVRERIRSRNAAENSGIPRNGEVPSGNKPCQ